MRLSPIVKVGKQPFLTSAFGVLGLKRLRQLVETGPDCERILKPSNSNFAVRPPMFHVEHSEAKLRTVAGVPVRDVTNIERRCFICVDLGLPAFNIFPAQESL